MRIRILSVAVLAATLGVSVADLSGVQAQQTLRTVKNPAELPPASFKGQMYVDSKGCVFLRAGYGGVVNWVPRVGANRRALCGLTPTLQALGKPVEVDDSPQQAAPEQDAPMRMAAATPSAPVPRQLVTRSPAPQPTVMASPAAMAPAAVPVQVQRQVQVQPQAYAARSPAPQPTIFSNPVVVAAPAAPAAVLRAQAPAWVTPVAAPVRGPVVAAPVAARRVASGNAGACDLNSALAQVVNLSNGGAMFYCPTGAEAYQTGGYIGTVRRYVVAGQATGGFTGGSNSGAGPVQPMMVAQPAPVMVAPVRVQAARVQASGYLGPVQGGSVMVGGNGYVVEQSAPTRPAIPQGWKAAWDDDRLNPMRGVGTATGQMQQDQIWTRETPARLVSQVGVRRYVVVQGGQPLQQGGYYAQQPATGYVVQQPATGYVQPSGGYIGTPTRVVISSKSEPRAAVAAQPVARQAVGGSGKLYVQVGTFGDAGNAEAAKARLRAAGLPVGTAQVTRGGRALQMVMAGPFGDAGAAQSVLGAVRAAGFGDAFIR